MSNRTSNQRFTVHDSPYALVGEIERLTAELAYAKANANTATNTVLAENVVLKAERGRLAAELGMQIEDCTVNYNQRVLLTQENDRLRAALETIASGHTVAFPAHIARESLAGEDRPKDRPVVNAAYPIGYSEPHAKRSETAETVLNADKVAVSRLSDETKPGPEPQDVRTLCDAMYSPYAHACAKCKVCGWEIKSHKIAPL